MTSSFRRTSFVRGAMLLALLGLVTSLSARDDQFAVSVNSPSPGLTRVSLALDGYDTQVLRVGGRELTVLSVEGLGFLFMDQAGHPQLPALHDSVALPDDARMELRVLRTVSHDVAGVDLVPWRGPIPRNVDPASVPYVFGAPWSQDAFFPAEVATLGEPYVLRDVRGAVLTIAPFQYNPVTRVLRVHDLVEVEVVAAGPGGANAIDRASYGRRPDRSFAALYRQHFLNPGTWAAQPPPDVGNLLIISHGPFMEAVLPLVEWKLSQGQAVELVDVATIGNNATAIKNFIAARYAAGNLAFVLLVGDNTEVQTGSYAGGLSDPNYSTMTPDWYPDLFVGRFSAKTVAHVQTQVQRTIEYEAQSHDLGLGDWNAWGLGLASAEGAGIGHYGEADIAHQNLIRNELLGWGFAKVDQVYDPGASKTAVKNALNEGRRIVNYIGHGSSMSWGTTGFSNTDVAALANAGHLPIIQSVACVNGQFNLDTCFAEAWLRSTRDGQPIGAVATYMSSINQYWAEPMYAQGNHMKNGKAGACEHFWLQDCGTVAGMWFAGSCTMMEICGSAGRDMFMTWNVFGDPSLRLYGSPLPAKLLASATTLPLATPAAVDFTVKPGAEFAGAQYFLLAGITGSVPGFDLAGGTVHVPLNWDLLTQIVVAAPNGWVFDGFSGTLDAAGTAHAVLDTAGVTPLDPLLLGQQMTFAAVAWHLGGPFEMATEARTLTFVP